MTLPSFIGVGTAQWTASNGAAIPSMSPVDGVIGDLLLLVLERSDSTAAPAVTNWTNIAAATGTNSTVQSTGVYWKVATSATGTSDATGTVSWGTTTTTRGGVVLRFRDCSAVAPVHNSNITNVASTATTVNATNFSTTVNNCIAVFVASMVGARSTTNTTTNWTAGTGVTAFASQQTTLGGDETIGYGEKTFAALGSLLTPGIVWTTNTTTGTGQGILIALREVWPPNAPTSSAATNIRGTSFTANWTAPSTDSTHDAATGYQLDVATDAGFSSLVVGFNNLDVGNVTTKSVTGLSPNTPYWYQVRAYNTNATASSNSGSQTLTTLAPDVYGLAVLNTTGLVAYWRLDESSGQALDIKGSFDATTTVATQSATGLLASTSDTAYSFNGSTDSISIPFNAALNPAIFSIEAWVQSTAPAGASQDIFVTRDLAAGGFKLDLTAANRLEATLYSAGAGVNIFDPTVHAVPQSQAFHIVCTYDGANARFYTNGVLVAGPTARTYAANTTTAATITGPNHFQGTIDEVALYNVELSLATISDHYTKGSTNPIPPGLGPLVGMSEPFMFDTAMMR